MSHTLAAKCAVCGVVDDIPCPECGTPSSTTHGTTINRPLREGMKVGLGWLYMVTDEIPTTTRNLPRHHGLRSPTQDAAPLHNKQGHQHRATEYVKALCNEPALHRRTRHPMVFDDRRGSPAAQETRGTTSNWVVYVAQWRKPAPRECRAHRVRHAEPAEPANQEEQTQHDQECYWRTLVRTDQRLSRALRR